MTIYKAYNEIYKRTAFFKWHSVNQDRLKHLLYMSTRTTSYSVKARIYDITTNNVFLVSIIACD